MKSILLALLLLSTTMCIKKEPIPTILPEATTYGANTFGCRINNDIFIPKTTTPFSPRAISWTFPDSPINFFRISARRSTNNDKDPTNRADVYFNIVSLTKIGPHSFNSGSVEYKGIEYDLDTASSKDEIFITKLDTVAKIVSGTFSFSATNNNKTITVSEGRFDLKSDMQ